MEAAGGIALILLVVAWQAKGEPGAQQDFCVADLGKGMQAAGYPCKSTESVTARDFVSTLLRAPGNPNNNIGFVPSLVTVDRFPGLNTQGLAFTRIDFAPRGTNPPHVHPRASEIFHVIQGTLYAGFVASRPNNNTLYATTLLPGDLMIFPAGLLHFQLNVGNCSAVAVAALNSHNPGRWDVAQALFDSDPTIPDEIIAKNFGLKEIVVSKIKQLVDKTYEF